jgi:TolA-binding protein
MKPFGHAIRARVFGATLVLGVPAVVQGQTVAKATQSAAPAEAVGYSPSNSSHVSSVEVKAAGSPAPSDAQPSVQAIDAASKFFWEAHEQYQLGKYSEAMALFERSYALVPAPETLYNIALASANAGHCDQARSRFAEFAKSVPDGDSASLAPKTERLERFCPPPADKDEHEHEHHTTEPDPNTLRASPREAAQPGAGFTTKAIQTKVPTKRRKPALSPAQLGDSGDSTPHWMSQKVLGWSLLGSALVTTGAAAYFNAQRRKANSDIAELEELHKDGRAPNDAADRLYERDVDQRQARWAAIATSVAATGFLLTGVGLLLLEDGGEVSRPGVSLGWRGGVRVGLSGKF